VEESSLDSKEYKKYHCVKCGKTWGEGDDSYSYGLCLECFGDYINVKKVSKGQVPCFGTFNNNSEICNSCKWNKFCKEFYDKCKGE